MWTFHIYITSKVSRSPPWLCWPFWNICVTNDHGYVPFVVSAFLIYDLYLYRRVCNNINITGATSRSGTTYPSGAPDFTLGFLWGSCYSIFSCMCMFCRSLFVLLSCDLQILLTLLVSSNSSYRIAPFKV